MRRTILAVALVASFSLSLAPEVLGQEQNRKEAPRTTEKAKDPVCNMIVQKDPKLSSKYEGETYYFCMKADMLAFNIDPDKYLHGTGHTHPDPRR